MKNKESWQLFQEREVALSKNRKDQLAGDNVKKAMMQGKNERYLFEKINS